MDTNKRKPMRRLFLLTKDGKTYNVEGLQYISKRFAENHNIKEHLAVKDGDKLNNPKYLAENLKKYANACIVISKSDDVITIADENFNKNFIEKLESATVETSWEIAVKLAAGV